MKGASNRAFHFLGMGAPIGGALYQNGSNGATITYFKLARLLQSGYDLIEMLLIVIIAGLAAIFSTLVYDWWKYGRVRN